MAAPADQWEFRRKGFFAIGLAGASIQNTSPTWFLTNS
jgi:hypothetical protein